MRRALVMYVKSPSIGGVKTRLTRGLGALSLRGAALFYESLLLDFLFLFSSFASLSSYDFFVCPKDRSCFSEYMGVLSSYNILEDRGGGDLGLSMYYSIEGLILRGYSFVCLVGSDIPFLTNDLVMRAFILLGANDLVLGPSYDGGTYLVGSSGSYDIFRGIEWSRGEDFGILCGRAVELGFSYGVLDRLMDVDTGEDFLSLKALVLGGDNSLFAKRMPRTYSFLEGDGLG